MNIYETEKTLNEYLLFHYGEPTEISSPAGTERALFYPQRCVTDGFDLSNLPPHARALDLGCAVGASSFELSKYCDHVVGIDLSHKFIEVANVLKIEKTLTYSRLDQGNSRTTLRAKISGEAKPSRIKFETGDACKLRSDLGRFDLILMANLIDRLGDPAQCLAQLPALTQMNAQVVITTPYTWLEDFTPKEKWLDGLRDLKKIMETHFDLVVQKDLPLLIREHERKFQLSIAQASRWRRKK